MDKAALDAKSDLLIKFKADHESVHAVNALLV